jgi:hypothetical protein
MGTITLQPSLASRGRTETGVLFWPHRSPPGGTLHAACTAGDRTPWLVLVNSRFWTRGWQAGGPRMGGRWGCGQVGAYVCVACEQATDRGGSADVLRGAGFNDMSSGGGDLMWCTGNMDMASSQFGKWFWWNLYTFEGTPVWAMEEYTRKIAQVDICIWEHVKYGPIWLGLLGSLADELLNATCPYT